MDQCEIYDAELILNRLLIDSAAFETVEKLAFGFIEERARELEKVVAWGPLTEWRKPQVSVEVWR